MTREEQIIEAGTYHLCGSRPPKTCGHNMHELTYISRNFTFEAGAKWADEHPNPEMVNAQEFIEKACKIYRKNLIKFNPALADFPTAVDEAVNVFRKQLEE